jgi:hypothetical protein
MSELVLVQLQLLLVLLVLQKLMWMYLHIVFFSMLCLMCGVVKYVIQFFLEHA